METITISNSLWSRKKLEGRHLHEITWQRRKLKDWHFSEVFHSQVPSWTFHYSATPPYPVIVSCYSVSLQSLIVPSSPTEIPNYATLHLDSETNFLLNSTDSQFLTNSAHSLPHTSMRITPKVFHSKLKSHLFKDSYPTLSTPPLSKLSRPQRNPP